jgi:hypothetical protein
LTKTRVELKRRWKDRKNKKDKKPKLYFHVLQIDEGDGFGFYDLDVDRDWGLLYKLKLEWIEEAPEFKYRIVTRSTSRTWSEVFNNEI